MLFHTYNQVPHRQAWQKCVQVIKRSSTKTCLQVKRPSKLLTPRHQAALLKYSQTHQYHIKKGWEVGALCQRPVLGTLQ